MGLLIYLPNERPRPLPAFVGLNFYGNHAIRAAVTGMERVFAEIHKDGGIQNVDAEIVPVGRIFELQGVGAMKENEKKYLR